MVQARIVKRTQLFYADGADVALDRPAHVRAGSGIAVVETPRGRRLLIVQDDASFLALVHPDTHVVDGSIALPAGPNGRRTFDEASGTKKHKLDLESVALVDGVVLAFGSGSTEKRERVVVARVDRAPEVALVDAHELYASLRAHPLLTGAELNLEGIALDGAHALLFQRGNGAGAVDAAFTFARADLRAYLTGLAAGERVRAPGIVDARRFDLGTVRGTAARLTFTDAHGAGGKIYVVAAAEDSPNAVDDGEIVGCALGVLGDALAPILDESGAVYIGKPEGLALDPDNLARGWLVVDKDDPTAPAELFDIALG